MDRHAATVMATMAAQLLLAVLLLATVPVVIARLVCLAVIVFPLVLLCGLVTAVVGTPSREFFFFSFHS